MDFAPTFFNALFENLPPNGRILLWRMPGRLSDYCETAQEAADLALERCRTHDVYVGMGVAPTGLKRAQRATEDQVIGIPGFWADIDFDVEGKKKKYPPNLAETNKVLDKLGVKPSMVVMSGNGIHAYWLFDEMWLFKDNEERWRAAALSKRWQATIRALLEEQGWTMDSTFDLARVLRPAGTTNRKDPDNLKPISILEINDFRYTPDTLEGFMIEGSLSDVKETKPIERSTVSATDVIENTDGKTPEELLPPIVKEYIATDHHTKQWWERKRHDVTDESASTYDYIVCNIGVYNDWSDADIAKAIFCWRLKYGENPDKVVSRPDYLARTINNCRGTATYKKPELTVDKSKSNGNGQQVVVEVEDDDNDDDIGRAFIDSTLHGPKCMGVVQYRKSNTEHVYHMFIETETGEIKDMELGTVDTIRSKDRMTSRFYDEDINFNIKKTDFPRFVQAIRGIAVLVESNEVTDTATTIKWVTEYFKKTKVFLDEEAWGACYQKCIPFLKDGYLHLDGNTLISFVNHRFRINHVKYADLSRAFDRLGFEEVTLDVPEPFCVRWTVFRIKAPAALAHKFIAETQFNPAKALEDSLR